MKIKICGVRTIDDVVACAGSDYMGLMFYQNSKRFINLPQTLDLYRQIESQNVQILKIIKTPESVAVVVNPTAQELDVLFSKELIQNNIKIIQFHGQESGAFCEKIAKKYQVKYWKALPFSDWNEMEIQRLLKEYPHAEYFLVDSPKKQQNTTTFGGTGHQFNWYCPQTIEVLKKLAHQKPIMIAGGVNTQNIEQAVLHFSCLHGNVKGFDLSSGVESFRNSLNEKQNEQNEQKEFYKDEKKIKQILKYCSKF